MVNKLNNTTAGLAGLLQGVYTGIQANRANAIQQGQLANQTKQVGWEDPNRPVTDLDRVKVNPLYGIQAQAFQNLLNGANTALGVQPTVPTPQAQPLPGIPQAQNAQTNTQNITNQANTPIPITQWTPDDFTAFQARLKKIQGAS